MTETTKTETTIKNVKLEVNGVDVSDHVSTRPLTNIAITATPAKVTETTKTETTETTDP